MEEITVADKRRVQSDCAAVTEADGIDLKSQQIRHPNTIELAGKVTGGRSGLGGAGGGPPQGARHVWSGGTTKRTTQVGRRLRN